MYYSDLNPRSVRERVDAGQVWTAWLEAEQRRRHSFLGFLDWEERSGREYLYSRKRGVVKSLGRRSPETERIRDAFHEGRAENASRLTDLSEEMNRQAAVLRALGLGRLPVPAARILRAVRLAAPDATVRVVGTNAIYAYEAMAGVMFDPASTATGDIDILVDDRNRLKLVTDGNEQPSLIGLIQREVDMSFQARSARDYRLTNNAGYMVEFIRPEPNPVYRQMPGAAPLAEGDVEPAPMRAADPRFWAAHKLWLAEREDRDPEKKIRDRQQGQVVLDLIATKLPQFRLDEAFMNMMPGELRPLLKAVLNEKSKSKKEAPDW